MLKSMKMAVVDMLSPTQCRMARAALGLSITEASKVSLVSRASIARFESGNAIRPVLQSALKSAYERLGVQFTLTGVEVASAGAAA